MAGTTKRRSGNIRAVVWRPGSYDAPERIRHNPRHAFAYPVDIAGGGTIAGQGNSANYVWTPEGRRTELASLEGNDTWPDAVANGWVAGTSFDRATGDNDTLLWRLDDGALMVIHSRCSSVSSQ